MRTEVEPLQVNVQVNHADGSTPFGDVLVEAVDERDAVVARP
jgi:hypothetical protein